jgi:hypothetical protein
MKSKNEIQQKFKSFSSFFLQSKDAAASGCPYGFKVVLDSR